MIIKLHLCDSILMLEWGWFVSYRKIIFVLSLLSPLWFKSNLNDTAVIFEVTKGTAVEGCVKSSLIGMPDLK